MVNVGSMAPFTLAQDINKLGRPRRLVALDDILVVMSAPTEFEGKVYEESAATAFQLASKIVSSAVKGAWDLAQLQIATRRYLDAYLTRHGHVKILGMAEPLPLRQLYTDVKVVSRDYLNKFATVDDLERTFRERNRQLFDPDVKRRDALAVANETQYLTVLGAPGAGKSTFLRRIGLEALLPRTKSAGFVRELLRRDDVGLGGYRHDCMPILVELRRFRQEKVILHSIIRSEFEACGFHHANDFIEKGLRSGAFLVLLDGLDEVPLERLDYVVDHVRDFVNRYARNRYVISCRTAFYKTYFARFTDVVIADFDERSIRDLINKWFSSDTDRERGIAAALWRELVRQPATFELARTPLLLTFVCIVYDATQGLPSNRTALYRKALDILLERWSAEKRVHNEPIYRDLHPDIEIEMLSDMAGAAFEANRIFFSRAEILDAFRAFASIDLNSPKIDATAILDAIEIQQGLLVCRAADVYSFSHLTMQEYLTAVRIHSAGTARDMIHRHLFEERWREVLILLAGLMRGDEMIRTIQRQIFVLRDESSELLALLESVERMQASSGLTTAAGRLVLLDLLLLTKCAVAYVEQHDITDLVRIAKAYTVAADRIRFSLQRLAADGDHVEPLHQLWETVCYLPDLDSHEYESRTTLFTTVALDNMEAVIKAWHASGLAHLDAEEVRSAIRDFTARIPPRSVMPETLLEEIRLAFGVWTGDAEYIESLTLDAIEVVNRYVYGLSLLCEVRFAALRVSPMVWSEVRDTFGRAS